MTEPEFEPFSKIPRANNMTFTVTEKIDGTNAQIYISEDPAEPLWAGSRNRWLIPRGAPGSSKSSDNYDFADWVQNNAEMLRRLGPGRHFGEWWGAGIGRRYGLTKRRFSLFQAHRWAKHGLPEGLPTNVSYVPILAINTVDHMGDIPAIVANLFHLGSVAQPGFPKPEGVVVQVGGNLFKITDGGNQPKWLSAIVETAEQVGAEVEACDFNLLKPVADLQPCETLSELAA